MGDAVFEVDLALRLEAVRSVETLEVRLGLDAVAVTRVLRSGFPQCLVHEQVAGPGAPGGRGDDHAAERRLRILLARREQPRNAEQAARGIRPRQVPRDQVVVVHVGIDAALLDDEHVAAQPQVREEGERLSIGELPPGPGNRIFHRSYYVPAFAQSR